MNRDELYKIWKQEEKIAHIHGWNFEHIHGRYEEEDDIPWNYREIIESYLDENKKIMDYDTGGAEFLLSLGHPYNMTSATEGYLPNIELCKEKLIPLGVDFRACDDPQNVPFDDESFDIMINRHGSFCPKEIYRMLKNDGIFITQQVGGKNDRDLVEFVLPDVPVPFPDMMLDVQKDAFEKEGFKILQAKEAFRPIRFYDVGAFVWFAHIIEWEFPGFSVDKCFDKLLKMHEVIEKNGVYEGTIHRYLIVAQKKI